jgi:prepilin-type N-terminal cleavage/methylation domain-containing protein/prepilin-type processing-associated H-X9-DG protein
MKMRRAFTLIELLVSVAIIALLIAILLPSLGRAREQSKKTKCQSNLHAIGLALHMYAANNNDAMPSGHHLQFSPSAFGLASGTVYGQTWAESLIVDGVIAPKFNLAYGTIVPQYAAGAISGSNVFLCPNYLVNDKYYFGRTLASCRGYGLYYKVTSSWGNDGGGLPMAPTRPLMGTAGYSANDYFRITRLSTGINAQNIIGADGWQPMADNVAFPWKPGPTSTVFTSYYGLYMRHFDNPNYLFGDGHVEWSNKYHALKTPTSNVLADPLPWQHP